jgi:hypothetical protein
MFYEQCCELNDNCEHLLVTVAETVMTSYTQTVMTSYTTSFSSGAAFPVSQ